MKVKMKLEAAPQNASKTANGFKRKQAFRAIF